MLRISKKTILITACQFLATLALLTLATNSYSNNLFPRHSAVAGGIARVTIKSTTKPMAYYKNNKILVVAGTAPHEWQAIVGIPLLAKAGKHTLTVKNKKQKYNLYFKVQKSNYSKQYIKLKNKNLVSPNTNSLTRIKKDIAMSKKAYASWDNSITALNFQLPLKSGRISGKFGNRRYFNKKPRRPHSGVDIASPLGTAVHSVEYGKVILTGDFFFNGKSVFIDHGFGIISLYFHLNSIDIKQGEIVNKGDIIGTVGKTGRSTGSHLHFGVSVNNARVNPNLFFAPNLLTNTYSIKK